ncbi:MAG: metal ABC transporter permease [Planctomycetaceae bacterium]
MPCAAQIDPLSSLLGIHGWAMATAAVVAAACGLVGTLLVVRRMSLVGDAISHAVLPGIAVAVLAGGRPGGPLVLAGAVAAALLTVWLTRSLRAAGGPEEDAGAGVVFTTLFAIGVLLVGLAPPGTHLDAACVLHGELAFIPFDTVAIGGLVVPRGFLTAVAVLAAVVVGVAATWKVQVATAFDPDAARAAGLPVAAITCGLLAATAVTAVASFDAVGAVLVVALLVAPAAAAELLVKRLHLVAGLAMMLGGLGGCLGYLAAWRLETSAAGMIAVVLGLEYCVAAVVAPADGLIARLLGRGRLAWRVACEDRLAAAWRAAEAGVVSLPRTPQEALVTRWLEVSGRLSRTGAAWLLTTKGRREAENIVRSHRLWEAWLGRHADLPLDHLHPPAEWVEHHLGAGMRERLQADVDARTADPHGREIPPEA